MGNQHVFDNTNALKYLHVCEMQSTKIYVWDQAHLLEAALFSLEIFSAPLDSIMLSVHKERSRSLQIPRYKVKYFVNFWWVWIFSSWNAILSLRSSSKVDVLIAGAHPNLRPCRRWQKQTKQKPKNDLDIFALLNSSFSLINNNTKLALLATTCFLLIPLLYLP